MKVSDDPIHRLLNLKSWGFLCAGVCIAVGLLPSFLIADDRQVFLYQDGNTAGALIHDRGLRWVENIGGIEKFQFEEVVRTDDMIELLDRPRDVGLKVYSKRGELRLPRATDWIPWMSGRWGAHADRPASIPFVPSDTRIRLVYLVPADREPIDDAARRIRVVMEFVSDLYGRALKEHSFEWRGFEFERDVHGVPIVHVTRTKQPARYFNGAPRYDQNQHFVRVASEIPASIGAPQRHMLVVFPETYEPGPAPVEWDGSVGVGAHLSADGGVAVMSAWILRDEFCAKTLEDQKSLLFDESPIDGRASFQTRQMNSPRFEFIEDGWGAAAHELGHALGLPHDHRSPTDLMGQGFRDLRFGYRSGERGVSISRDNARLLAVSRYLSPAIDVTDQTPPTAHLKIRRVGETQVVIELSARDDRRLASAVFLDLDRDTVIGSTELQGRDESRELTFQIGPRGGNRRFQAKFADASGNITDVNAITGEQQLP